jgi:hypothetical protein
MNKALQTRYSKLALFFVFFICIGAFINKSDMYHYNLFHAMVEAIVEKGTFQIKESNQPRLNYAGGGDAFEYRGGRFAAKQPGAMLLAAIPYYFLQKAGINYVDDYYKTTALVALLSTCLYAALAMTLLFSLLSPRIGAASALILTCFFGFGTNFFAYASNLHHDATATSFLVISFYFIEKGFFLNKTLNPFILLLAGFCLGFVPFISMLPSFIVLSLFLYAMSSKKKQHLAYFLIGFTVGLLPLITYNSYYFGAPWIQQNMAGGYTNTFFDFSPRLIRFHSFLYFGTGAISALWYIPIYYFGFLGLFFLNSIRQKVFFLLGLALHFTYLLNIESFGHCQYGPRFLLPTLPYIIWGLVGLWGSSIPYIRYASRVIIVIFGLYGIAINTFGAWMGTMYCEIQNFPVKTFLEQPDKFQKPEFPLWNLQKSDY